MSRHWFLNWKSFSLAFAIVVFAATGFAQRRYRRSGYYDVTQYRNGVPTWELDPTYAADAFTFVRVKYTSQSGYGRWGNKWDTDYPDSDLNFSLRLHQLTSLQVNPNPIILELTDDEILDYPFVYIIEPGAMQLTSAEVEGWRNFCKRGGFVMIDDFWGDAQYENLARQLKRVFPDREPVDVPIEHEIFHCVYDIKEKPQVPAINSVRRNADGTFTSWESTWDGSDTSIPHYRAITDDEGRIMVFICHNTDLGDGWEREGEQKWYFDEFSVKKAYPMGINIVVYAMTH
ncbi:MAG: DUF4159 domain-containing protein [Planctomycetota bacterium]